LVVAISDSSSAENSRGEPLLFMFANTIKILWIINTIDEARNPNSGACNACVITFNLPKNILKREEYKVSNYLIIRRKIININPYKIL
jgi:hypothetical protein